MHPFRYSQMSYCFHYTCHNSLVLLCMCETSFGQTRPFAYLDELKTRFETTYGTKWKTAIQYGMQTDFSRVMRQLGVR